MKITYWVIIALAALAAIIIIALIVGKQRQKENQAAAETKSDDQAPVRRRPDPARRKAETDDDSDDGSASPLIVGAAQITGKRGDQGAAYAFTDWKHAEALDRKGFMAVMACGLDDGQAAGRAAVDGAMDMFDRQSSREDQAGRVLDITAAAQRSVLAEGGEPDAGSGCTFLCVLINGMEMSISSVGDGVIALYRSGVLLQLNRAHVLGREIDERNALAGERRVESAQRRKAITAYLGKRELRTIDRTLSPTQLVRGDRILLMDNGAFDALGDSAIIAHLDKEPRAAAEAVVRAVADKKAPGQDHAAVVIIGVK